MHQIAREPDGGRIVTEDKPAKHEWAVLSLCPKPTPTPTPKNGPELRSRGSGFESLR